MINFKGKPTGTLDIKRCHLDVTYDYECPECGYSDKFIEHDGDSFNYPLMNEPIDYFMRCHNCEHTWDEKVILNVSLQAYKSTK